MTTSARDYLLGRFRADAETLRQRATALERGAVAAGPDSTTSSRMADACADVVDMLEQLGARAAPHDIDAVELDELAALVPVLQMRSAAAVTMPSVRAVYVGAATRIGEILAAESGVRVDGVVDDEGDDADDDDESPNAETCRG